MKVYIIKRSKISIKAEEIIPNYALAGTVLPRQAAYFCPGRPVFAPVGSRFCPGRPVFALAGCPVLPRFAPRGSHEAPSGVLNGASIPRLFNLNEIFYQLSCMSKNLYKKLYVYYFKFTLVK